MKMEWYLQKRYIVGEIVATNCAKPLLRKSQFNLIKINNDKKNHESITNNSNSNNRPYLKRRARGIKGDGAVLQQTYL